MGGKRKTKSKKPNNNNNNHPPRTVESNPQLVQTQCDKNSELDQAQYDPTPVQCESCDKNPELGQAEYGNPAWNITNVNLRVNSDFDLKNWKCYTEEQLEELVLKKLEMIYYEAYMRLVSCGHPSDVVHKAIHTNGHGLGKMDILSNIIHNSLRYMKNGSVVDDGSYREGRQVFRNMRELVKHSLAMMIDLLCQVRPDLIKGPAMWCLLMSDFQLDVARTLQVPFVTNEGESQVAENNNSVHSSSGACNVQGDQLTGDAHGFGKNGPSEKLGVLLDRNVSVVKSFNLTPSLEAKLKKSIGNYAAACRATVKMPPKQPQASNNSLPSKMLTEPFEWNAPYMVNLVLGSFGKLSLNEKLESELLDLKIESISSLVHDIKEIKQQVKERKEWAQKKVIQAAKKLSHDLLELKMLRMESKENLKNCKLGFDLETVKRIMELENALMKTGREANLENEALKRLEIRNAEIRAEVEAFKLSASESDEICAKVVRKEKKCFKRILALEKQNNKYQEEIEEEKRKSLHLQQHLVDLKKAQEELEVMWRQEVNTKELAIVQAQEELRLKEEVEVNKKRKQDALQHKMEIGCQRYKDDMQRLEQEISYLQVCLDSRNLHNLPDVLFTGELEHARPQADTFQVMLPGLGELLGFSEEKDRVCLLCMENEASVVFLPCAHQVLCSNCTEFYYRNVDTRCPCCQNPIAQRIRVYGSSS